jgi:hypothetical protein
MPHLLTPGIDDQMNPESRNMLPKQAFTGFASRYVPPTLDEGFVDITKVDFEVRCRSLFPCASLWHTTSCNIQVLFRVR